MSKMDKLKKVLQQYVREARYTDDSYRKSAESGLAQNCRIEACKMTSLSDWLLTELNKLSGNSHFGYFLAKEIWEGLWDKEKFILITSVKDMLLVAKHHIETSAVFTKATTKLLDVFEILCKDYAAEGERTSKRKLKEKEIALKSSTVQSVVKLSEELIKDLRKALEDFYEATVNSKKSSKKAAAARRKMADTIWTFSHTIDRMNDDRHIYTPIGVVEVLVKALCSPDSKNTELLMKLYRTLIECRGFIETSTVLDSGLVKGLTLSLGIVCNSPHLQPVKAIEEGRGFTYRKVWIIQRFLPCERLDNIVIEDTGAYTVEGVLRHLFGDEDERPGEILTVHKASIYETFAWETTIIKELKSVPVGIFKLPSRGRE